MANELNMCGNYLIIFLFTVHRTGITFIISLDVDTTNHRTHFRRLIKEKEPKQREKQGEVAQHVYLVQSSIIIDYYSQLI